MPVWVVHTKKKSGPGEMRCLSFQAASVDANELKVIEENSFFLRPPITLRSQLFFLAIPR